MKKISKNQAVRIFIYSNSRTRELKGIVVHIDDSKIKIQSEESYHVIYLSNGEESIYEIQDLNGNVLYGTTLINKKKEGAY